MKLHLERRGHGLPTVWLHGWSAEIGVWGGFPDIAGREAILFDLPGHGGSPWAEGLTLTSIARAVLDELAVPADFVGWSMGGVLGMACALLEPAKVKSLAVLATSNFGGERAIRMREALARDKFRAMSEFYRGVWSAEDRKQPGFTMMQVKLAMKRHLPSVETLVAIYDIVHAGIPALDLARVTCPVLFAQGTADVISPISRASEVAAMIPGARVEPIGGAGHAPFLTFPDACHKVLNRFWETSRDPLP
ncbi:MAG: alpha/beta hydrolase [Planctomycetes bacterium]|nr:alpha/beta hydrolase [Planctomycetota bacterium]